MRRKTPITDLAEAKSEKRLRAYLDRYGPLNQDQLETLQYLAQNGPFKIVTTQRCLTPDEQDYVEPLVRRIDQFQHDLAHAQRGDAGINKILKEKRVVVRELRDYLFEHRLHQVSFIDKQGKRREVQFQYRPGAINLIIR
jgi:hypothetical protein